MNSRAECMTGKRVRRRLPMNNMAGDVPSALGVFRHSSSAASKFSLPSRHFLMSVFMLFTAFSARPLLWLLNGLDVSWTMPCAEQNSVNAPLNWGPLSDLRRTGKPQV